MFDFETTKLSEDKIKEIAENNNKSFLEIAIKANGYNWCQKYWPEIVGVVELSDEEYVTFGKILKLAKTKKGVIGIRSLHEAVRKIKPFAGCTMLWQAFLMGSSQNSSLMGLFALLMIGFTSTHGL